MKSTWALVLSVGLIVMAAVVVADESSAAPEFPSVDEIFSTVQAPNYSFDRFVSDFQTMFSEKMFRSMMNYGGNLIDFIANDTFVADIGSGNLSDSFNGPQSYINIFVLACFIIAVVCILGAVLSYVHNRDIYLRNRED